jgi:hypothetical protein
MSPSLKPMGKHSSRKLQLEQAVFNCSALMTENFSTGDFWGDFMDRPLNRKWKTHQNKMILSLGMPFNSK